MMFRRTIFCAVVVGLLAGIVFSVAQTLTVTPIIHRAEAFEVSPAHDHTAHEHSEAAWEPADGVERTAYTYAANVLAGIGFAAVLLALMSQLQQGGLSRVSLAGGSIWGVAAFLTFFVAPGIGLPPEIPGVEAAPLGQRGTWWLVAVISVGLGLLLLAFAPLKIKVLAPVLLALPYLVDIPQTGGPLFAHTDPEIVATLTQLHQQFIIATGASNFLFWQVLGVVSAWVLNRWVLVGATHQGQGRAVVGS